MLKKIFVICNQSVENDRYKNMEKQFKKGNINKDLVEYYLHYWKSDIEEEKKKNNGKFIYQNYEMRNLNNGEISLFVNNIELFKKIKEEYKEGYFLILESDAYVFPNMKFNMNNINDIINSIQNIKDWDIVNVGARCEQIFCNKGYPKSNPIKFNDLNFYKEDRLICTEALIWNYKSITKILKIFNNIKKKIITKPIDVLYDDLARREKINLYWTKPPICTQASGTKFKSHIRGKFK